MATLILRCPYCGRNDFASTRGLNQHQQSNVKCNRLMKQTFGISAHKSDLAHHFVPMSAVLSVPAGQFNALKRVTFSLDAYNKMFTVGKMIPVSTLTPAKRSISDLYVKSLLLNSQLNRAPNVTYPMDDDDDVEWLGTDAPIGTGTPLDTNNNLPTTGEVSLSDNSLRQSFQKFAKDSEDNLPFTDKETVAINLMSILRKSKASLRTYDAVMHWHFVSNGTIAKQQPVSQCTEFIGREKLFDTLKTRYNCIRDYRTVEKITLPHSKAKAGIVCHDAKAEMISLLTDPRIKDSDYLFFADNPLASPPQQLNYVEDLNTGRAYTATYRKLITKPGKQVLLPVIFYIDAANTGHFVDLPVTAVQFSLGIFSRKAREKEYCWRTLGYIPAISKHKSKGRRIMLASQHVEGVMAHQDALEDEGEDDNNDIVKAQDLHTMLKIVLKSYIELQNSGFMWDLFYRNKMYKDVEFVLFTPFFKLDGEEADRLCGKYTSRTGNVAQLCRYCTCPTKNSDNPLADYPLKTTRQIRTYICRKDEESLKQLSQHLIDNALYVIRFGRHNKQGLHGACPTEMLHALLLGVFRYIRDCFFEQIGENSKLANTINGYAKEYGFLLSRQSDRDFPNTRFGNGISRGKLMATEYQGILLCMASVLRSSGGREILSRKRKEHFGTSAALRDWSVLVETLLQWDRWLRSDVMEKKHVKASRDKHRYIMYLIKKVGKRSKGMGFNTQKFHQIVHMADDILNFGVPLEVDTGTNESAHKSTKVAARLTQRNEKTFDLQTAKRLEEVHLVELAEQEMLGNASYNYGKYPCIENSDTTQLKSDAVAVGGVEYIIKWDDDRQEFFALQRSNGDKSEQRLEKELVDFVGGLQKCVENYTSSVTLRSYHKRMGHIFRGQNRYRGEVWRDWAIVDWGDEGQVPNKLYGFVDLRTLPAGTGLVYAQIMLEPTIYAVVENSVYVEDDVEKSLSEIFVPITKQVRGHTGEMVSHMTFFLADVETIVRPIAVIPDIGGRTNDYFLVKDREKWREDFIDFLEKDLDVEAEISDDDRPE